MNKTSRSRPPHLLIAIPTKGSDGRDRVEGIIQYMNEHSPWRMDFLTDLHEIESVLVKPQVLGGYSGVIAAFNDTLAIDYKAVRQALRSVPTVIANECLTEAFPPDRSLRAVFVDNALIGAKAAEYLTSLGRFGSFAFCHGPYATSWSRARLAAFKATLPAANPVREITATASQLSRALKSLPKPAAVFASCDFFARDVVNTSRECALNIPRDVVVLGCDNDLIYCEGIRPRITSIRPDFTQVGYRAAQTLDRLMQGRAAKIPLVQLVSKATVVERESTKPIQPAVALVERATAFIANHACSGIDVRDVVRTIGVSRSLLDSRFRELRGKSMLEDIHDVRFARLCELLRTSPAPIGKLARECGFSNIDNLMRTFRRRYGMTMSEWRQGAQAS